MKPRTVIILVVALTLLLSMALYAQQAPAPDGAAKAGCCKNAAAQCAKDGKCAADCCKDGKCSMAKDGKCCGNCSAEKSCCTGKKTGASANQGCCGGGKMCKRAAAAD